MTWFHWEGGKKREIFKLFKTFNGRSRKLQHLIQIQPDTEKQNPLASICFFVFFKLTVTLFAAGPGKEGGEEEGGGRAV